MKPIRRISSIVVIAVAAGTLFLAGGGVVSAGQDEHSVPYARPDSSTSGMYQFYAGSIVRVGEFPGKLVCLRCDLKPSPGAMKRCEKEGHRHALAMDSDSMIHPLVAVSEDVLKQINSGDLHGKEVSVHGKYYPASGIIAVDRIAERKGGVDR